MTVDDDDDVVSYRTVDVRGRVPTVPRSLSQIPCLLHDDVSLSFDARMYRVTITLINSLK